MLLIKLAKSSLKKFAKRTPEEMNEIRLDLASKKLSGDSIESHDSKSNKKSFSIFAVLLLFLSISMFFIVPFILYLLSHIFYFLGDLINIYENFLSNYFEPEYVGAVGAVSFLFFGLLLLVLVIVCLSEFLESAYAE